MNSIFLRLTCCLLLPILISPNLFGQSFSCGADQMRQKAYLNNPGLQLRQENFEKQWYDRCIKLPVATMADAGASYVIPVVVHIIHQNGPENITDARVLAGIDMLNASYANSGYYDQGTGVVTPVQFCLARQTPDGVATTGIDRVQSPLTDITMETEDLPLKNLTRWDPTRYLNIWLVREIVSAGSGPGVAGYAYFPTAHGTDIDGIVMEARYMGGNTADNCVLTHEAGHYLGLYHTFEGGCTNNDCAKDGDQVCDTPPDQSTAWLPCGTPANTCSTDALSGFTSDQPDMTINYMDYATIACYSAFTAGQRDRIEFFINAARASLLSSKGCLDPCLKPVSAAFSASAGPSVIAGTTVNFYCPGLHAATFSWAVDGTPAGASPNMSYAFNAPGEYVITLHVGGADPNCFDTRSDTITVVCGAKADFTLNPDNPEIGETVTLTNTSAGATAIQWSINGTGEGAAAVLTKVFPAPGSYSICLSASNAYCQDVRCKVVEVRDTNNCVESFFKSVNFFAGTNDFFWAEDLVKLPGGQLLGMGRYASATHFTRFSPTGNLVSHWRMFPNIGFSSPVTDVSLSTDGFVLLTQSPFFASFLTNDLCYAKLDVNTQQYVWYKRLSHPSRNVHVYQISENPVTKRYQVFGHATKPGGSPALTDEAVVLDIDPASGDILAQKNYSMNETPLVRSSAWSNGVLYTAGRSYKQKPMLAAFDAFGAVVWSREYNLIPPGDTISVLKEWANIRHDNGSLVAIGASGKYIFFMKTDLDGNPLNTMAYYGEAGSGASFSSYADVANIEVLPDGYLVSILYISNSGVNQIVLIKTDKNGGILWKKSHVHSKIWGSKFVLQDGHIYTWSRQDLPNNTGLLLKTPLLPASSGDCAADTLTLNSSIPQVTSTVYHPAPIVSDPILAIPVPYTAQLRGYAANTLCSSVYCPEICNNNLDDDGDGLIDCADTDDCPCNNSDCAIPLAAVKPLVAGHEEWQSPQSDVYAAGQPIVANLNPQQDNIPEIIMVTHNDDFSKPRHIRFYAGDGSNAANPAQLTMTGALGSAPGNTVAVGDLDGNGIPELIVPFNDNRLRVFRNYDPQKNPVMLVHMSANDLQSSQPKIGLADFDGDGKSEIYSGHQIYWVDDKTSGLPVLRSLLPATSPLNHYTSYAADLLSVADCNGNPDCAGLELVAGNTIYSVDLADTPIDGDPRAIIPRRTVATVPGGMALDDGPAVVADVDLDGELDVVVRAQPTTLTPSYLYVWNAHKFIKQLSYPGFGYLGAAGLPSVVNVFDDTKMGASKDLPEILFSSSSRLYCLNLNAAAADPANPFWWSVFVNDPYNFSNPVSSFDFDGNGQPELVFRYQDSLKVLYGGAAPFPAGVQPDRTWFGIFGSSGTEQEYPAIADVDNDGQTEIVFAGADPGLPGAQYNNARLRVIGADLSKSPPWKPSRRLWNQFSYAPHLVNDDLSIPKIPLNSAQELPAGSGTRPFNIVLGQKPLAAYYNGHAYLPDGVLELEEARCAGTAVEVRLKVCNIGSEVLPAGTPLRFYLGDPTTGPASLLPTVYALPKAVAVDSCQELTVSLPKQLGQKIVAVLNDDGKHVPPYKLPGDFPLTGIGECDYANNLATFELPLLPSPPQLGPDIEVCQNGVWTFKAGPGFEAYRWSNLSTDSSITVYEPGTYWVETTDHCGLKYRDTVLVKLTPAGVVDLGPDRKICGDSAMLLQATPGFTEYRWFPADDLSCTDCPNPVVHTLQSRTYAVQAKSALGCFSFDTVAVEVNLIKNTEASLTLCAGDSVMIFGKYETTTGSYAQTFASASGCDSTHRVDLLVLPVFQTSEQRQICAGDSLLVFGKYEKTSGLYAQTFSSANGCDSIHRVDLTVLPVFQTSEQRQICSGDSLLVFGNYEKTSGLYAQTFSSANGCDSIHRVDLTVLPVFQTSEQRQICSGDSLLVFGNYEKTAGLYAQTFSSANGCDSTHRVDLTVLTVIQTSEQRQICAGDSLLVFGNYEKTAGSYAQTFASAYGCDSIHRVDLTVLPVFQTSEQRQICAGDSLLVFGKFEKTAGSYAQTFASANGCDSTHRVDLAVLPVFQTSEQRQICAGDSLLIFGNYQKTSGLYARTFPSANGCDSTHRVDLSVLPVFQTSEQRQICAGDSLPVFGNYEKIAGLYTRTFSSANGCDSTHQVDLTVLPVIQTAEALRICAGDSAQIFGKYEKTAGLYSQTFQANGGCDSVHTVELLVLPPFQVSETRQLCTGDSTLIFGAYETKPGVYTRVFSASNGCDSVHTITLSVLPALQTQEDRSLCAGDSILVFGKYISKSGTYSQSFQASGGCDSVHTVILAVLPVFQTSEARSICAGDSVLLFGHYVYDAGVYAHAFQSAGGCDSTVSVDVKVLPAPVVGFSTAPSCPGDSTGTLYVMPPGEPMLLSLDSQPFGTSLHYSGLPAGGHDLRVRNNAGCETTYTFLLEESPPIGVILPGDTLIQAGQSVQITAAITGTSLVYNWSPAFGLSCASCPEVLARPQSGTDYTLQVSDIFGCTASDQMRIDVQEKPALTVYVPDAFKPDGAGANQFFTVYASPDVREIRRLEVYDRWGGLVFRREHFDAGVPPLGWDGKWRGQDVPPGVYLYLLEVELINGALVRKTGDVTVLR